MVWNKLTDIEDNYKVQAAKVALEKAAKFNKFNTIPWKVIISKRNPREMASSIREYSHKGIIALERIYYKDPAYVVQSVLENEQLAIRVESCVDHSEAIKVIGTSVDIRRFL